MAGIGTYVNGWTDLAQSGGSRILYVSSSVGDNSYNGLHPVWVSGLDGPKRTIRENTEVGGAYLQLRDENPDWLCLLCGDTFTENGATGGVTWELGGLSASEPMVVTSYRMDGATVIYGEGTRPILNDTSISYNNGSTVAATAHDVAFINLEFKGSSGANTAMQWSGSMLNILVEGCLFYDWNILADFANGNKYATTGMATATNFYFRRNVCHSGYGMGVMFSYHNALLIEENLFDINGVLAAGAPHVTLHDVYSQKIRNLNAVGNIFARGGNFGLKMSADFIAGSPHGDYTDFNVENNLFYNNGLSLDWSGRGAAPPLIKFAIEDNTGGTIDPAVTSFVGSVASGTYSSTQTTNATFHSIDDSGDVIDIIYGWDMWFDSTVSPDQWMDEGQVATSVIIDCYVQGSSDEMKVKAWNFSTTTWDIVGTLTGADTTDVVSQTLTLTANHTGPEDDADEGKVYIRVSTDSTTPSNLSIDKIVLTADPAYTHKDGTITNNIFTLSGRSFGGQTAEWTGSGQDFSVWPLSGQDVVFDGNLWIHKPDRANAPILQWSTSYYFDNVTVQNSVVYDWDRGVGFDMDEAGYLNYEAKANIALVGNEITAYGEADAFSYPDPTRSLGTYYDEELGETVSDDPGIYDDYGVAFLVAARSQLSKTNWNTDYTAAAVNTWIRTGFGINPGAISVTPGTATLTLTGYAPTVRDGGPLSVTPGTAALTLTPYPPTVVVGGAVYFIQAGGLVFTIAT